MLRNHLYMLLVQLELRHGVHRAHRVLLHGELSNPCSVHVALSVAVWLNLDLLGPILLLDVHIVHHVVQVSFQLLSRCVLKNGTNSARIMVYQQEFAFAFTRISPLEQNSDVTFDCLQLLVPEESHVEAQIAPLLVDVIRVIWREVLHPRNEIGSALKVQVYAEVWQAFKNCEYCVLVHFEVILLHLLH